MTLAELGVEYRGQVAALDGRIRDLKAAGGPSTAQAGRIRTLETMRREARDLAVLCERYYERGYRRNAKYTL